MSNSPGFKGSYASLALTTPQPKAGALRRAQIGAAWAIGAHFSKSGQPALIAIPTGVGKSAIITLVPFILQATRVVVVVPGVLLRDQIAEAFSTLSVLRESNIIAKRGRDLKVKKVTKKLTSIDDWNDLKKYDVVIGTPSCLSSEFSSVVSPPKDIADLVIVDEAHHTAARSWRTLLDDLSGVRQVLFTATPFRRDDLALPGSLVFDYPMALAIAEQVYAPIKYVPVDWSPGMDLDQTLAVAAKARLGSQRQLGESAFIARAGDIKHAERLVAVYAAIDLKLTVVHSNLSLSIVRKRIVELKAGAYDGIAMVGVLSEGFDFPTLKLAVYHERHKSLPATLQFIGRIARIQKDGNAIQPELLARREVVHDETAVLYNNEADWEKLLPDVAARLIANVQARTEYIDEFRGLKRATLDLGALYPSKTVEIYNCISSPNLGATIKRVPNMRLVLAQPDKQKELLVVIAEARVRPRWMHSTALDSLAYELFVFVHDKRRKRLFVMGDTRRAIVALLKAIGADDATLIDPQDLQTILAHHEVTRFNAVGMRNSQGAQNGAPSYKTSFARSAGEALLPSEQLAFGVGHLSGIYGAPGNGGQVGITIKRGKIYTPEADDLLGLKAWCLGLSAMIEQPRSGADLPLRLKFPRVISEFPALAFAAILDEELFSRKMVVIMRRVDDGAEAQVHQRDLDLIVSVAPDKKTCGLSIEADGVVPFRCTIDTAGKVVGVDDPLRIFLDDDEHDLVETLNEFPIAIYFSDGSSFNQRLLYPMNGGLERFPDSQIVEWAWGDVNIRRETSTDRRPLAQRAAQLPHSGLLTIHEKVEEYFKVNEPTSILIKDDGSGEIADHVKISVNGERVDVIFIHSKYSSEDKPGGRLKDLNEVVCQAMRSRRRVYGHTLYDDLEDRLGSRAYTRIVQDGGHDVMGLVKKWRETPPVTTFSEWIVQPGIKASQLRAWHEGNILLQRCAESLLQVQVPLKLVCNSDS